MPSLFDNFALLSNSVNHGHVVSKIYFKIWGHRVPSFDSCCGQVWKLSMLTVRSDKLFFLQNHKQFN